MAHYVLSDVHGEGERFHKMLEKIHFSESDILYILGDVVDRGPDGIALLEEIRNTPNMELLLGNHEYMMLQYLRPEATEIEIFRWNRNGNAPTLRAYRSLGKTEQQELLSFLRTRQTYLEVTILGQCFHLVHGFPGENVHDRVWGRPGIQDPNPIPDCCLIIGHTPVIHLIQPEHRQLQYLSELESKGDHLRICHAPGFLDIDCGCGHRLPVKALACLRLEDMEEFYT
ncbi:MAG: metallophosphoesterase [Faecousia sp.]